MFTRFEKDFATHTAVLANTGAQLTVSDTTLLETKHGWRSATLLKPGMEVATLDGGFKPIASVKRASSYAAPYHVPAGALGNCAALHLPGDVMVGMQAPVDYVAATSDHVSLPIQSLEGHFGITRSRGQHGQMYDITLDDEEMLWSNTGLLLHAKGSVAGFFQQLNEAQAEHFLHGLATGSFDQENRDNSDDNCRPKFSNCWAERELVSAA